MCCGFSKAPRLSGLLSQSSWGHGQCVFLVSRFYNSFPHRPTESEAGPALACPFSLSQYASAPHKVGLQVDSGPHFPHTSTNTYTYSPAHTHTTPSVPAYPLGSHALPRLDTAQGLYLSAPLCPPSQLTVGQPSETFRTAETRPPDN